MLSAQERIPYESKNYTIVDGLPDNVVYNCLQDSRNYLWFFTSLGASRFDGRQFENFDISRNLADNEVFGGSEDRQGRIWFSSFNGKHSYFDIQADSIVSYRNQPLLKAANLGGTIVRVYEDKNFNTWILGQSGRCIRISASGKIKEMPKDGRWQFNLFPDSKGDVYRVGYDFQKYDSQRDTFIPVAASGGSGRFFNEYVNGRLYYEAVDGIREWSDGVIRLVIPREMLHKQEICDISGDRNNNIFVGVSNGFYQFSLKNPRINSFYDLGVPVSNVFQDQEEGYWVCTMGKGVLLLPPGFWHIAHLSRSNGLPADEVTCFAHESRDRVLFGVSPNTICQLRPDGKLSAMVVRSGTDMKINHCWLNNDHFWFQGNNRDIFKLKNFLKSTFPKRVDVDIDPVKRKVWIGQRTAEKEFITHIGPVKNVLFSSCGDIYMGCAELIRVHYVSEDSLDYDVIYDTKLNRIYALAEGEHGKIWFGGVNNFGYYDPQLQQCKLLNELPFESTITDIAVINPKTLLVGTDGSGVYLIQNEKIVAHWREQEGLSSNICKKIICPDSNQVWIGTKKGITFFRFLNGDFLHPIIKIYGGQDNTPSLYINDLLLKGDMLYAATSEGLYSFNTRLLQSSSIKPNLYLVSPDLFRHSPDTSYALESDFSTNVDKIKFVFQAVTFLNGEEITYRYRLNLNGVPQQEEQLRLRGNLILPLAYLSPGKYRLEVSCSRGDGLWSNPVIANFEVCRPLWKRNTALVIYGILISLFVIGMTQYYNRNRRKSEIAVLAEKKEKLGLQEEIVQARQRQFSLEQESIRARIDPHFVFNCLNGVLTFVYRGNMEGIKTYLPRLARLIRKTMQLGKEEFIDLASEIRYLEDYLLLEKMRFEDQFDYSIRTTPSDLDTAIQIPPLLIQIFVENAIRHGISHLPEGEKGLIQISFILNGETLLCVVEDNGLGIFAGRSAKNALEKQDHQSMGLEMVEKRIDLLNKIYQRDIAMSITEKASPDSGTIVKLRINTN